MQWTMYKSMLSTSDDCSFPFTGILNVHINFVKIESKLKETVQDDEILDDYTADYKPDERGQETLP